MYKKGNGYRKTLIQHVRMQSNAGFYLGSIEFENGEGQPYDRDSGYYPTEEFLASEYPNSISLKEAFEKASQRGAYKAESLS